MLTEESEIYMWGSGEFGQIQTPTRLHVDATDIKFKNLSIGKGRDSFGAAIDIDGFLYTWGDNQYGQLGLGDFVPKKVPSKVNQLRKKRVNYIASGGNYIVALGKDVPEGYVK